MRALDFETALSSPDRPVPPPVCLSAASLSPLTSPNSIEATADGVYCALYDKDQWRDAFRDALDSGEQLIFAFAPFDTAVAGEYAPELLPAIFRAYDEDRIVDCLLDQKLIDIALGEYRAHGKYNLATLAKRMLGYELAKEDTWRLRYSELLDIPIADWPQEAIEYAIGDSVATLQSHLEQERSLKEVDRECVLADRYNQSRAYFALHLASSWGMITDADRVACLKDGAEKALADLRDELLAVGLLREEKGQIKRCVKKARERMAEVCPNPKRTDKGGIKVSAEACRDSGDPILENYAEYARLQSFLSGPVALLESGITSPIHTRFDLAKTGRTTSSQPNFQNLPREGGAREAFRPRDGYVFVNCDYDKAELHTLAQTCIDLFGRSVLADVLNSGKDPHTILGAQIAHTTYEDLDARIRDGDYEAKEWRRRAKPCSFGFPGGMGAKTMVLYAKSNYGVIMTLDEAFECHESWKEAYPVVAYDYLEWIGSLTAGTGYATIEHFVSKRWRGKASFTEAANSFFQGRTADAKKAALWAISKKCYLPGTALYGSRAVNDIHDEFLLESPIEMASDAAKELQRTMIEEYNRYTPDVPVSATPVLTTQWSKKARTIIEDGEYKVWSPE